VLSLPFANPLVARGPPKARGIRSLCKAGCENIAKPACERAIGILNEKRKGAARGDREL